MKPIMKVLVIDIGGRLMVLGDDSQFVDLSYSLLDCFAFDPTNGLQPPISHIAANLEITGRVDAQAVEIAVILCPKD